MTTPQEPLKLTPEAFEETARVITYQWMRHVGHGYEDVEHYEQLLDDEIALHEEATDYAAVEELKATTELVVFVMEQLVSLAEFTAIERRRARDDAAELRAALERFKAWADRWEGAVYAGGIEAVMGTGPARKELLIAMNRASAALAATEGRGDQ